MHIKAKVGLLWGFDFAPYFVAALDIANLEGRLDILLPSFFPVWVFMYPCAPILGARVQLDPVTASGIVFLVLIAQFFGVGLFQND